MMRYPRRLVFKVFVVMLMIYTVLLAVDTISKPPLTSYKQRIMRTAMTKVMSLRANFLATTYNFDTDLGFMEKVKAIKDEKVKNDWANEFWDLDSDKMSKIPLSVSIPSYYRKKDSPKPLVQPFDPRFTLGVYLHHIATSAYEPIPFHWSDWVDMSNLRQYIFAVDKPRCRELFDISLSNKVKDQADLVHFKYYCDNDKSSPLGFKITEFTGPQTTENREILGKAHLFTSAPSPMKLVFLTDSEGSYEVTVKNYQENDLKNSLLMNNMVEKLVEEENLEKINVLKSYRDIFKKRKPQNQDDLLNSNEIVIPNDSFDFDVQKVIAGLDVDVNKLNNVEKNYLESLKFSASEENPPKFFNEAKLVSTHSQAWLGEHYDWRFFNGLTVGNEEQVLSLHRLVKNYLNFARLHGIITWIAHGSLLSWYWNGIAFPWDTDIDVQVPIAELHKMSRRFNQTLIIENVGNSKMDFSGMGRYYVDIGSSITHRVKGNGNNNIDGRFIDVDTGLYIDITALALTDSPAPSRYDYLIQIDPNKKKIVAQANDETGHLNHLVKNQQLQVYNCRNNHYNTYEELSPLVSTLVENQYSYIPSNFIMTLNYEYDIKGFTQKNFKDYIYLNNFRIWVKTQTILDYLNDKQRFLDENSSILNNPNSDKDFSQAVVKPEPKSNFNKRVVGELEKIWINKLTYQDHLNLLQHNQIFKEYWITREFTKFHSEEMKLLAKKDESAMQILYSRFKDEFPLGDAIRQDLFLHKLYKNDWKHEEETAKLVDLTSIYNTKKKQSKSRPEESNQ